MVTFRPTARLVPSLGWVGCSVRVACIGRLCSRVCVGNLVLSFRSRRTALLIHSDQPPPSGLTSLGSSERVDFEEAAFLVQLGFGGRERLSEQP